MRVAFLHVGVYFRLYAKMADEIEQPVLYVMNDGAMDASEIRQDQERDNKTRLEYRRFR